ncbi:MAG: preprotein translocase subunit SecA, partial [Ginsengibacter sp.]
MSGFLSKLFGGNKSEKDVKLITPYVARINTFFEEYRSLSNDELRHKTVEFKKRIKEHLTETDDEINTKKTAAEALDSADIEGRDRIYQEVDAMLKARDNKIEEILLEILPEAFAVVKETARRFKENKELKSTATEQDKIFSVTKKYIS